MNKQHILDEIRRTAKENGGVPLGTQRFAIETGIKKADWYGKHWKDWGSAVTEAGFNRNRLQEAYDPEVLLEKLAALARELGRFPVSGDLRMKRHTDAGFPSHNVFERLGSKNERVLRVVEYCRNRDGYQDVMELCSEIAPSREESPKEAVEHGEEFGFVYLLRSGRHYKIGRSNAAGRREYELAIQLPEKAAKVHEIRTDDPVGIEAYWHKRFESKRKNGEWFELTAPDIKAFQRRKFM